MIQPDKLQASLIGQRLLESGLLSEEKLIEALQLQTETGLLLGEICLLKGWLPYSGLKECLPPMRSRLGERLLGLGYIGMEQLWLAILEQRHCGEKLGEILIRRGWVDRQIIDLVVANKVAPKRSTKTTRRSRTAKLIVGSSSTKH
ncbi:hypothetical protein BH10CYA1_BH10CYA1_51770 [soil metagenome]